MKTPEVHLESIDTKSEEGEPLPTTEDRLLSHLEHIRILWDQHTETLTKPEDREAVKVRLREAYEVVLQMAGFLSESTTELLLQPATLEAAKFELWFARHHLHKVIK